MTMTGKEMLKLLKKNGFIEARIEGSHHIMKKGSIEISGFDTFDRDITAFKKAPIDVGVIPQFLAKRISDIFKRAVFSGIALVV